LGSLTTWKVSEVGPLILHRRHVDEHAPTLSVAEFAALREHVTAELQLPVSREPVHVYLFADADRYAEFFQAHFPQLPPRRAYFVQAGDRLNVYAQADQQQTRDLRHEVTHGFLHAVHPHLPIWLDEGLAEYYEVSPADDGWQPEYVRALDEWAAKGDWRPDLARLERLESVADMSGIDYAESWLWVYSCLHNEHRETLRSYLQALRRQPLPGSPQAPKTDSEPALELRSRLGSNPELRLLLDLQRLARRA